MIAVNMDERFDIMPSEGFKPVGSVTTRIVTLQLVSNDAMRLKTPDFAIHPNVDGIGLTSTKIMGTRS